MAENLPYYTFQDSPGYCFSGRMSLKFEARKQADLFVECLANTLWRQILIVAMETLRISDGLEFRIQVTCLLVAT